MDVPLFDLKAQYKMIQDEVEQALLSVLREGRYILGRNVEALEKEVSEYFGVKFGVGVASGTDALLLSLKAIGIREGDEVITTPYTFIATSEAISNLKAVPVFVDIDPRTYNIDPALIPSKINERTKAIIPVHLFGQCAEMERIVEIAKKYDLWVIEDAAQAAGAEHKGRKAGSIGDVGCLSFFPTKNLAAAGDGGMIITNEEQIAERVRMLRVHGARKKYYHPLLGCNSRLDELQAALLRVKLKYLDEWNEKRRRCANLYDTLLKERVTTPYVERYNSVVYHQYVIRVKKRRDDLQEYLRKRKIETGIYYPLPLHLQECYRELGYRVGDFPNSELASRETLALPMYPELHEEQIRYVAEQILNFFEEEGDVFGG